MERRTFLETAAAAVGGLVTWRPLSKRPAKRAPSPRWEWEVGEWYLRRSQKTAPCNGEMVHLCTIVREWDASATIFGEEMPPICDALSACNASAFVRVVSGHIRVESIEWYYTGDGLSECQVRLRETQWRQDGVYVLNSRGEEMGWIQHANLVNFYNVFRGSHAVVSVGGKEVRKRIPSWPFSKEQIEDACLPLPPIVPKVETH